MSTKRCLSKLLLRLSRLGWLGFIPTMLASCLAIMLVQPTLEIGEKVFCRRWVGPFQSVWRFIHMRFFYSDNTHGFYLYVLCCLFYCIYCRWKRKSSSHASERMLHYSMSRIYKQYQYRFSRCAENCGGVWSRGRHSWLSLWWVLSVSTWTSCGKIFFFFHTTLPFYLQWIIQN